MAEAAVVSARRSVQRGRGDESSVEIGRNLRSLRARRGLSLRRLAGLIGASPSLLSQVENGKVNPSVDTLYQLSNALGVPIASLFGVEPEPDDSGSPAAVVRRDARVQIELQHGVTWGNLLPHEEPALRFMEIRYAPGATSGSEMLRHAGRDMFYVLAGRLTFRVGFAEHVLEAGDSISYGDFEPHQLRNEGEVEARAVVCVVGDLEDSLGAAIAAAGDSHASERRTRSSAAKAARRDR